VTDTVITALAVLGVMTQAVLAGLLVVVVLRLLGVHGPWDFVRETVAGSELWIGFVAAFVATAGSLYFSEAAHFIPCKLCWFQRVSMYPLVLLALLALRHDRRAAQYLLPLPLVGLCIAAWHMLVERGVIAEAQSCAISAPGGCATRWIEELGYITIPTLAATAFALIAFVLALGAFRPPHDAEHLAT
jgi:disulfide bond formation protein DsbB